MTEDDKKLCGQLLAGENVAYFVVARMSALSAEVERLEQNLRAVLFDYHNGSPCEQIRADQKLVERAETAEAERDRLATRWREVEAFMDEVERAGGDAPHRVVMLEDRIRVQLAERDKLRAELEAARRSSSPANSAGATRSHCARSEAR